MSCHLIPGATGVAQPDRLKDSVFPDGFPLYGLERCEGGSRGLSTEGKILTYI